MTTEPIPVPIWPHDATPERIALIKEAKALIDTDAKIYLAPAQPGSPGRILCFGDVQPWCAQSVFIKSENTGELNSVRAALEFWLKGNDQPPSLDEAAWLSAVMGCGVTLIAEITEADAEPRPAGLRAY